jgi:hypothetical protein
MANEKQLVRALTEPTIVLDEIRSFTDEQSADEKAQNTTSAVKTTKQMGAVTPVVQILSKVFVGEEVTSFSISMGSGLPTCSVKILITDKSFYSRAYPKDGDLMSIFVRSKDDVFKPIRNDYLITSVSISAREGANEDAYESMTVDGELFVPGYKAIKCFSKKGTSFKALMQVATDLKLGFASNEVDTTDEQSWICPWERTMDFIDDVTNSAWKDENSFFYSFVDPYYYLNFVNVEPLFGDETEIEETMMIDLLSNDYGNDNVQTKRPGKTVISNWEDQAGTPFYIKKHSLFNNSASVNLRNGYKRYVLYYDALLKESQSVFVDPKTTEGAEEDKMLLKGRPNENFYLDQIQANWFGVQYGENGENCHEKYNIAKVQNYQNLVHLGKMGVDVVLQSLNPNLRLMQSVPLIIVVKRDATRKSANAPVDQKEEASGDPANPVDPMDMPFTIDKTVSGFYVVWGMEYVFRQGEFRQHLKLVRREWPTPPNSSPPAN